MHAYVVLAFVHAPADADARLKIPAGFQAEDSNRNDISDYHYLKLLNFYGTRDFTVNWF